MDILQDYAIHAYHFYNTCDPYLRPIRRALSSAQARASPHLMPLLNRAAVSAQDAPGLLTLGVLLLLILIVLQIINVLRRIVMWWIRVLWWVSVTAVLVLAASLVYQRGPERTIEDVAWAARHLSDIWWREYRRWEGYQKMQSASR